MKPNWDSLDDSQKALHVSKLKKKNKYEGTVFEVTVLYKGGNQHSFLVTSFSFKGVEYSWSRLDDSNRPLLLGVEDIAAIYQTGCWE